MNFIITLFTIGPRMTAGSSPSGIMWSVLITRTPSEDGGTISSFGVTPGSFSVGSSRGTFGPCTSASRMPTRAPRSFRPAARFAATVVFPTPPFPEATATTFFTPGKMSSSKPWSSPTLARRSGSRPASSTMSRMSLPISISVGEYGALNARLTLASSSPTETSFTSPIETMSSPLSGSSTSLSRSSSSDAVSVMVWCRNRVESCAESCAESSRFESWSNVVVG